MHALTMKERSTAINAASVAIAIVVNMVIKRVLGDIVPGDTVG